MAGQVVVAAENLRKKIKNSQKITKISDFVIFATAANTLGIRGGSECSWDQGQDGKGVRSKWVTLGPKS